MFGSANLVTAGVQTGENPLSELPRAAWGQGWATTVTIQLSQQSFYLSELLTSNKMLFFPNS